MQEVDLLVLGGGPAGYSSAIRASQLGQRAVVIEQDTLGGTCLNRGCIPTKSLLESAGFFKKLNSAREHGISLDLKGLDYAQVISKKDLTVGRLVEGLRFLLDRRSVQVVKGRARFISEREIQVDDQIFRPKRVVVATGTVPVRLPGLEPDGDRILDSDQLLSSPSLPQSLVIVGGGVIGCEFATIFASYGVQVTIVELLDQLLFPEDREIAGALTREFKKQKIRVLTGAKVEALSRADGPLLVEVSQKGRTRSLETERVLVAVGRRPLIPEGFPGELDSRGYIKVDASFQSSLPHIYAAGDVIGGLQLAHLAFEEGWAACNRAFGQPARSKWFVPACVYSQPEIGSVGLTEEQARQEYGDPIVAKYSLKGNGKAVIMGDDAGFCKIVASPDGIVRGVSIIGPQATELISGATVALENQLSLGQWAQIIYPHPTVSEAIKETLLSGLGTGLHSI